MSYAYQIIKDLFPRYSSKIYRLSLSDYKHAFFVILIKTSMLFTSSVDGILRNLLYNYIYITSDLFLHLREDFPEVASI